METCQKDTEIILRKWPMTKAGTYFSIKINNGSNGLPLIDRNRKHNDINNYTRKGMQDEISSQ